MTVFIAQEAGSAVTTNVQLAAGERRPSPLAWVLLLPIRFYRAVLSPLIPPSCRFYPSCSAYAVDALTMHGGVRGLYLAVRRVLRCHPWHSGGVDPVPEQFTWRHSPCHGTSDERE